MPPPHRQRSRAPHTTVASQPLVSCRAYHQHCIPVLQHSWQSPPCRPCLAPYHGHRTHAAICLSLSSHSTPAAPRVRQNEQHYSSQSPIAVSKVRPRHNPTTCHEHTSPHTRHTRAPLRSPLHAALCTVHRTRPWQALAVGDVHRLARHRRSLVANTVAAVAAAPAAPAELP